MALKPEWLNDLQPQPIHPTSVRDRVLTLVGRVAGSLLLMTLVLGALLSTPVPVEAQVSYDRAAAVNWAKANYFQPWVGSGECTGAVGGALAAGGISGMSKDMIGNHQLVQKMNEDRGWWEFKPIAELEPGDFILYSQQSEMANPDNWNYIHPDGPWVGSSLWDHSAVYIGNGQIHHWNWTSNVPQPHPANLWDIYPYVYGVHIKTSGSTTTDKPGVPTITSPGEGQTLSPGNVNISWTQGSLNSTGKADFNIQISTEPTFNPVNVFFARPSYVGTSVTANISNPGTYHIRIHQGDTVSMTGDWTPTRTFYVSSTPVPTPVPASENLLANPGFEAGLANWSFYGDCGRTTDYGGAREGAKFLSSARPAGSNCSSMYQDVNIPIQAGDIFTLVWWGRRSWEGDPRAGKLAVWFLGGQEHTVALPVSADGSWVCYQLQVTAPRSFQTIRYEYYYDSVGTPDLSMDSLELRRGAHTVCPDLGTPEPTPVPPTPLPPAELKIVAQSAQTNAALGTTVVVDLAAVGVVAQPMRAMQLTCTTSGNTILKGVSTAPGGLFSTSSVGTHVGSATFAPSGSLDYMVAKSQQDPMVSTDGVALKLTYKANALGSATISCSVSIVNAAGVLIKNVPFNPITITVTDPFGILKGTVKRSHTTIASGIVVEVRNTASEIVKTATTDATGQFSIEGLLPGQYTLKARTEGHLAAQTAAPVTVTAATVTTLGTATLQAGDIDGDGQEIGLLDVALYGASYTAQVAAASPAFDFNLDNNVNLIDYSILIEQLFKVQAAWQ